MRSRTIISIITAAILITACNSPENSPSVDVGNHNAVSETSASENIVINDKQNNHNSKNVVDQHDFKNKLGGAYSPEIIYANNDTVIVRYNCLIKFSLSQKRIVDYFDISPYKLDYQQGDNAAIVRNVSDDGNNVYFEVPNWAENNPRFYKVNISEKKLSEIFENDIPDISNLPRKDKSDSTNVKKHFKNDKRIVGFTTPESPDGSYSLDLYKSNGKLIEKIFL